MTVKTNMGLVEWAKAWLGQAYWFGTCCYTCSQSLLTRKAKQYPKSYAENRMSRYRADIAAGMQSAGLRYYIAACGDDEGLLRAAEFLAQKQCRFVYMAASAEWVALAAAAYPSLSFAVFDLPGAAVKYVRRIEELIQCPVALLSTSPERDDTILVTDPFAD